MSPQAMMAASRPILPWRHVETKPKTISNPKTYSPIHSPYSPAPTLLSSEDCGFSKNWHLNNITELVVMILWNFFVVDDDSENQ